MVEVCLCERKRHGLVGLCSAWREGVQLHSDLNYITLQQTIRASYTIIVLSNSKKSMDILKRFLYIHIP